MITRDATGRILIGGVTTRFFYAGDGDVPWGQESADAITRMLTLPGGVTITIPDASAEEWAFPNMQGHTLVTRTGTQVSPVKLYDPFGQPLDVGSPGQPGSLAIGTPAANESGISADGTQAWHQEAGKQADTSAGGVLIVRWAPASTYPHSDGSSKSTRSRAESTTTMSGPPTPSAVLIWTGDSTGSSHWTSPPPRSCSSPESAPPPARRLKSPGWPRGSPSQQSESQPKWQGLVVSLPLRRTLRHGSFARSAFRRCGVRSQSVVPSSSIVSTRSVLGLNSRFVPVAVSRGKGGDGKIYTHVSVPVSVNGRIGTQSWMVRGNRLTHRFWH